MKTCCCLLCCVWVISSIGQVPGPYVTGFPSLSVRPSSRSMGMGDLGMATSVGTQSLLYNPAMAAFGTYESQLSVSYFPWLRAISNDTRILNAACLLAVSDISALGVNLTYLDMGQIDLRDNTGATLASYQTKDYRLGLSYALRVASQHSLSVALKGMGQQVFGVSSNRYGVSSDIGYYGFGKLGSDNRRLHFGATVSHLGSVRSLPTTIACGLGYSYVSESGDQVTMGLDISRLLRDNWQGVRISAGMEYGFAETFFIRGGISLENAEKGDRNYFSVGAGYQGFVSDQSWGVDLHYLVPFGRGAPVSAFQNAFGITLFLKIGSYQ